MDQAVSGLLQSSQDAFNSAVSYTFSPASFKIRGYDSDYSLLYMNGVPVNDPEIGFASWSSWGGLNDVVRSRESRNGFQPTNFSFGGLGGATNLNVRASQRELEQGFPMPHQPNLQHRIMFTHSTGVRKMEYRSPLAVLAGGQKRLL
jgi:hypothetical protein